MNNIFFFIKHILGRNSNFLIYFIVFDLFPKTDLLQFRDSICHSIFISERKKEILKTIFFEAAFCRYRLKRMIHYYRWKKAHDADITTDMYQNNLIELPARQKIVILQNGNKFIFRLSDLLTIWIKKLMNSDDLFANPLPLTNPYTGVPFMINNLYNIYFALFESLFHIHPLLVSYFMLHFNMENFKAENCSMLQDVAIRNHHKNTTEEEKLADILDMVDDYVEKEHYLRKNAATNKQKIIKKLEHYLLYYYYGEYSTNPIFKMKSKSILKDKLNILFSNFPQSFYETYV